MSAGIPSCEGTVRECTHADEHGIALADAGNILLKNPQKMLTYAPDDESYKRLVACHLVFFDKRSGKAERIECNS